MNIYDKTHELVKAIKDSQEFKTFQAAKNEIESDSNAKEMVKNFISKHMELEYEMMAGKPEDKEKAEKIQQMYQLILLNSKAASFMQAYMTLQRVVADVYKILGDSVAEGMDFFDKK
ncbi:YlbF family regulator [Azotosporobacter soli]|uniref:YlbF family regulator n=1 Tax=Azotosporobacter soli TaxID=3055040 RepID=UPI0031FEBE49